MELFPGIFISACAEIKKCLATGNPDTLLINGERAVGILMPSCFQKFKYEFLKAYSVLCPVNQPFNI
jgi:hypothetical protein